MPSALWGAVFRVSQNLRQRTDFLYRFYRAMVQRFDNLCDIVLSARRPGAAKRRADGSTAKSTQRSAARSTDGSTTKSTQRSAAANAGRTTAP